MTGPIHPMVPVPLNVPSKPQVMGAATGANQKDRRRNVTMFDTHRHPVRFPNGRPWCGPAELAANRDVMPPPPNGFVMGDLMKGQYFENEDGSCDRAATLASVWFAPWTPYAKYMQPDWRRNIIRWRYDRMKSDEVEGLTRYFKAASKLGIQLNIKVEPGILPHPQIVGELGEPSRMVTIAEAAMAGDPWLLGFIDEPNPTLAEILGIHGGSGIPLYAAYEAPSSVQPVITPVEAVIAAPANTDLLAMLAEMANSMKAMQGQITDITAKKQQDKDRMATVRSKRHPKPQPVSV